MNSASLLIGITYIANPIYTMWNIFGIIYVITLFFTIVFAYFVGSMSKAARRETLYKIAYFYLVTLIVGMIFMMIGNVIYSNTYSPTFRDNIVSYLLLYSGFFGNLVCAVIMSIVTIKANTLIQHEKNDEKLEFSSITRTKKSKIIFYTLIPLVLLGEMYSAIVILGGGNNIVLTYALELFLPEFSFFFTFIFLSLTVIFLMVLGIRYKMFYVITVTGLLAAICCMLPLLATPKAVQNAEEGFEQLFGSNWEERIQNGENHLLQTPFSLLQYFLGVRTHNYTVIKNQVYYIGADSTASVDKNIVLYFDVYMPLNNSPDSKGYLPGQNATLIRIHGGGWTLGDKGRQNGMHINKYFAAQGYIVFDIQYGLIDAGVDGILDTAPENVKGDFSIDDMIRHIGIFTHYLAEHNEYGAHLNSTFVSGGSAGGHLAVASGLALASNKYPHLFSSEVEIKGIIPLYPALGSNKDRLKGKDEFKYPELLVNRDSPPCLGFHGTADRFVPCENSEKLLDVYNTDGSSNCVIIYFPYIGHANDLFAFQSHANLVFIYYMERFMYLLR